MKLKTATIDLNVKLTQAEIAAYGERLAAMEIELERMRDAKKETVKGLTEGIDGQAAAVLNLAHVLKTGEEERPVKVKIVPDLESYRMTFVDPDTGEVVFARAMTEQERQGDLPVGDQ